MSLRSRMLYQQEWLSMRGKPPRIQALGNGLKQSGSFEAGVGQPTQALVASSFNHRIEFNC